MYHSAGPKDEQNDYIVRSYLAKIKLRNQDVANGLLFEVDHTIIIYLMDPNGEFVDYFGQNRTVDEVVSAIRMQMIKYDKYKNPKWF